EVQIQTWAFVQLESALAQLGVEPVAHFAPALRELLARTGPEQQECRIVEKLDFVIAAQNQNAKFEHIDQPLCQHMPGRQAKLGFPVWARRRSHCRCHNSNNNSLKLLMPPQI